MEDAIAVGEVDAVSLCAAENWEGEGEEGVYTNEDEIVYLVKETAS